MKKAGIYFASSIAAASILVSSSSSYDFRDGSPFDNEGSSSSNAKEAVSGSMRGGENDKFAPKFDGLRFIETLVTAHRIKEWLVMLGPIQTEPS